LRRSPQSLYLRRCPGLLTRRGAYPCAILAKLLHPEKSAEGGRVGASAALCPEHQRHRVDRGAIYLVKISPPLRDALQRYESMPWGVRPGRKSQGLREGYRACMNWIDVHKVLIAEDDAPVMRPRGDIAVLGFSRREPLLVSSCGPPYRNSQKALHPVTGPPPRVFTARAWKSGKAVQRGKRQDHKARDDRIHHDCLQGLRQHLIDAPGKSVMAM
jgi:hypothetical protein